MSAVAVVDDTLQAQTLLDPTRLALLALLEEPDSASGLARRLGLPRQRVNYHLRELERHQLVEAVDEQRRGSVLSRAYRRTGRSYAISTAALGQVGVRPEAVADRASSDYQVAVASRAVRELGQLQSAAAAAGLALPTLTLDTELHFADPVARAEFAERLAGAVAELVAEYHAPTAAGARPFRLYLGVHPRP
jgi:DNA-binding transcriptional ArsR family regulator